MSEKTIHSNGSATVYVTPLGKDQAYITAALVENSDARRAAAEAYDQIGEILASGGFETVHERVFGSLAAHGDVMAGRAEAFGRRGIHAQTPVTYIHGRPLWGEGLAGASLLAARSVEPGDVWTVTDASGQARGRGWKRHGARFMVLQNLHGRARPGSDDRDDSPTAEAGRMFDLANQVLRSQQADYHDVTRTWLYLSEILGWYGQFNEVRNAKYGGFSIMPSREGTSDNHVLLPASTGIEGDAPTGAAATMDLLATRIGPGSPVEIRLLSNRRQKDAFRYGSAFSRGAAISLPDATWVLISGTAAIDERGVSLLPGDARGQMHKTIDIVEALIAQEGARPTDLCDGTVFLKRPEDAEVYRQVAAERGLENLPAVQVVADVCRDELLFEMDAAAVVARN